jgi:hypothetical protein
MLDANRPVFRALRAKNCLNQSGTKVTPEAYRLRPPPTDAIGISVGLSAADAVAGLSRNYGVASLEVKQIRAIQADCKLQVDEDPILAGQAHITGQRTAELAIAFALAEASKLVDQNP